MQLNIKELDLYTLLALYNQEVETFKEKLLNGESWENLRNQRRNITELAIVIERSHNYNVSKIRKGDNPAEFPQSEESSGQPAE